MTTRNILTIMLLALLPLTAAAQPQQWWNQQHKGQTNQQHKGQMNKQPRFDPQQWEQMMYMTIVREAGLTPAEAQTFVPLYKEMREKQRTMSGQIVELKKQKYNAEKDYFNAINKIKNLQVEMAELEANYYKRLCKAVGAEKIFKLMQAEDRFHRQMVRGNTPGNNNRQWGAKREK